MLIKSLIFYKCKKTKTLICSPEGQTPHVNHGGRSATAPPSAPVPAPTAPPANIEISMIVVVAGRTRVARSRAVRAWSAAATARREAATHGLLGAAGLVHAAREHFDVPEVVV